MNEDPLALPVEREENFLRVLAWVFAAHVVVLTGVWGAGAWFGKKEPEKIVWLDGGGAELGAPAAPAGGGEPEQPKPVEAPPAEPEPPAPPALPDPPKPAPPVEPPPTPPEIVEKKPTPAPTPKPVEKPKPVVKPQPTPEPKKVVKTTPKPETKPKPAEKPKPIAKPAVKPAPAVAKVASPKPAAKPAEVAKPAVTREGANGTGEADTAAKTGAGKATTTGPNREALRGNYGGIVGGRFKATGESSKPTNSDSNLNREWATLLRFKIARDGSVMSVVVVSPSGNQAVDQWITQTIPEFQRVPRPLPSC